MQRFVDDAANHIQVGRLLNDSANADFLDDFGFPRSTKPSSEQDWQARANLQKPFREINASHAWHGEVREHEIVSVGITAELIQCRERIGVSGDPVSDSCEHGIQYF